MLPRSRYSIVSVLILIPAQTFAQPASLVVKNDTGTLPEGARLRLGKVAGFRFAGPASAATMSLDGKLLAVSAANGNTVTLVDVQTGKTLHTLKSVQFGGGSNSMTFSPDGSTLAVQDFQALHVWDVVTGKSVHHFRPPGGRSYGPSFSKDGKIVAIGNERFAKNNQTGAVEAIEVATGKVFGPFETVHNYNIRVALAPDGKTMASFGGHLSTGAAVPDRDAPRTIQLWDLVKGKALRAIKVEVGPAGGQVNSAAFAPDGKTLAVCGNASTFILIDVETGNETRRFAGHRTLGGAAMRFSPDGKLLVVFEQFGGTLQGWKLATGQRLDLVDAPRMQMLAVAFPGNDRVLALGLLAQSLCWWDATDAKGSDFQGHLAPIAALTYTADGKSIITAASNQRVLWWDPSNGTEQRRISLVDEDDDRYGGRANNLNSVALAPDGKHAVTYTTSGYSALRLWNLKSGRAVCDFEGPRSYSQIGISFSPDGGKLATAGARTAMHVWDVNSGEEIPTAPAAKLPNNVNDDIGSRVAFSHDGKVLAVHKGDRFNNRGDLIIWDLAKKKELHRAPMPMPNAGTVGSSGNLAFSIDNKYLAVADATGSIILLNASTGREWRRFHSSLRNSAFQLAFSTDGRFLAAGSAQRFLGGNLAVEDPVVELWELSSGQKRDQFKGHTSGITCLAFSPDGASLATGSTDTTALVWDFTGKSHAKLAAFSEDELPGAWKSLAGNDAALAATLRRLVQTPGPTVTYLSKHFLPVKAEPIDEKTIDMLITDLDRGNFKARDTAARELRRLGERAEPALKRGLAANLSIEARRRMEEILDGIVRVQFTPEEMQAFRGVELLERIGSPEARAHLQALATGDPVAIATKEAHAALKRMKR